MNYSNLKISIRDLLKNKVQSAISIIGLGIGLGCILLICILAIHENSFDSFVPEKENVYRVIHGDNCLNPLPLAVSAKNDIPAIKDFFRFHQAYHIEYRNPQNIIVPERYFAFADESIFECLGVNFLDGSYSRSKSEIAISGTTSQKYFGNSSPIGAIMPFKFKNEFMPLTVSGVFADFPSNSSIRPNCIANIELTAEWLDQQQNLVGQYRSNDDFQSWDKSNYSVYLVLNKNGQPGDVANALLKYKENYTDEKRKKAAFKLQPITDIYLKSSDLKNNNFTRHGNDNEMRYYIVIAALILIISLLNYIVLSKARIVGRLKDLGTQKVLGATRSTIQQQLMAESLLIILISLVPAALVTFAGIPYINTTLNRTIDTEVFSNPVTWATIGLIIIISGCLTGFLIGRSVSGVAPVLLLKGKSTTTYETHKWGNSFLSIHFTIFIILVVGVLTVKKQINYALTNFKSIDPKNILIYELNSASLAQQFSVIQNEIENLPGVLQTAGSSFIPPFNGNLPVNLQNQGGSKINFDGLIMGQGMIELLGMELLEGETFGDFQEVKINVIFNESAALEYKLKAGEFFHGFFVKGIVKDFTAHSLHKLIQPMAIIQQHPKKMRLFAIKTDGKNDDDIISSMNTIIAKLAPNNLITHFYLTDEINKFYQRENQQASLIGTFSFLAIILSVMGLLGMIVITAARKTKEIGIRKVNGATIGEILAMLNKDFTIWVALAIVVAIPTAYYCTLKWLENFAYKTTLNWWVYALAGLLALGIALLTVSWQSWKAATRNPVEALRYE